MKEKIVASLQYGRILQKKIIIFLYVTVFLCVVLTGGLIFMAIYDKEPDVLICLIMPFLGFIAIPYLLVFNRNICNKVKPFLNDAIHLEAFSKEEDYIYNGFIKKIKIVVIFYYNGKKIIKKSGEPREDKVTIYNKYKYYDAFLKKYANRKINILYSPKYDQVLIVKDK